MLSRLKELTRVAVRRARPVLLRCDLAGRPPSCTECELIRYERWDPELAAIHMTLGRDLTEARLRRRFDRGLRFYALREDGSILATTWAVVEGERFVDEIALGFPVTDAVHWWRDIFVAPRARGRGVFGRLLDAVLATDFPAKREMWSVVHRDNRASLRAHGKRGFVRVLEYDVFQVARRLAVRLQWPPAPAVGSAYRPEKRVIWTGGGYRSFVADRLA